MSRFFIRIGWLHWFDSPAPPIRSLGHYRNEMLFIPVAATLFTKVKSQQLWHSNNNGFSFKSLLIDLMLSKDSGTKDDIGSGQKRINVAWPCVFDAEKQSYQPTTLFRWLQDFISSVTSSRSKADANGFRAAKCWIFNLKSAGLWPSKSWTIRNHWQKTSAEPFRKYRWEKAFDFVINTLQTSC